MAATAAGQARADSGTTITISGVVRFQGTPRAGVAVCNGGQDGDCTTTADDGSYTLVTSYTSAGPGIPLTAYPTSDTDKYDYALGFVDTQYPNVAITARNSSYLQITDGQTSAPNSDFKLVALRHASGQVVDTTGRGVAGATVCGTYKAGFCATTAADGSYQLGFWAAWDGSDVTVTASGCSDGLATGVISGDDLDFTLVCTPPTLTTAKPSISGKLKLGRTLTAIPGAWGPSGVKLAYQWFRDGRAIRWADTASYQLGWPDRGHRISVLVTGFLTGYPTASLTSTAASRVKR